MAFTETLHPATRLPDPTRNPELYADVAVKRGLAWILDSVAILALTLIAVPLTGFAAVFFLPILWTIVGLAYRIWSLSARSATPGMRMMNLELRNGTGAPLTQTEAIFHTGLYTVCIMMVLPALISAALIAGSPRRQGLPDLALGTAALNRPR